MRGWLLVLHAVGGVCALRRPIQLSRRIALQSSGALLLPCLGTASAGADEPALAPTATAAVTAKVRLEFVQQVSAEENRVLPVTIGLFGKDAPQAAEIFKLLCSSGLQTPCPTDVDLKDELMERTKQAKKAAYKGCLASETVPITYAYSTIWSIQSGKRIDCGAVQGKFALRVPPATPFTESSSLSHDAPGLLSVRRGGGVFDFGITTSAVPEYDADFAVIGRVVEGMDMVAELDAMPVVKAADALKVEASTSSRAKACDYASPQPFCAQNKPLRKVTLLRTTVL